MQPNQEANRKYFPSLLAFKILGCLKKVTDRTPGSYQKIYSMFSLFYHGKKKENSGREVPQRTIIGESEKDGI